MVSKREAAKARSTAKSELMDSLKSIAKALADHAQTTKPTGATARAITAPTKPDDEGRKANRIALAGLWVSIVVGAATIAAVIIAIRSLDASKAAVGAANDQVKETRLALEISQRAWVVPVDGAQFSFEVEGKRILGARVPFKNSGDSPALNLRPAKALVTFPHGRFDLVVLKDEWGPGDQIVNLPGQQPVPAFAPDQSVAVLANGADLPMIASTERGNRVAVRVQDGTPPPVETFDKMKETARQQVLDGLQDLLFLVRVDYTDIFKKEHRTYGCYLWSADIGPRPCSRLNSAN